MGRAGRPQFDDKGVACIMVHQPKKEFYKRFLYEPFPVESSLHEALHNHISAEVAGVTIRSKHDALRYLTWTYFFRRLVMNPAYYHLDMDAGDADEDVGRAAIAFTTTSWVGPAQAQKDCQNRQGLSGRWRTLAFVKSSVQFSARRRAQAE